MKRVIVPTIAATLLLLGCGSINKSAMLVNLKENQSKIEYTDNGFVAIKTNVIADVIGDYPDPVMILLQNEKNENYVITLNPELSNSIGLFFGPFTIAQKKIDKEIQGFDFLLFQLPKGVYRTRYAMVRHGGSNYPKKLLEETIEVEPHRVKYLGKFQIRSHLVFSFIKEFEIRKIDEEPKEIPEKQVMPGNGDLEVIADNVSFKFATKK